MPVTLNSVLQIVIFLVILLLLTRPMGLYLTNVFSGERNWLTPVLGPVERFFYKLCGINPEEEQKWTGYVIAMLVFSVAGMLLLYLIERTQAWLPLNPQQLPNVPEALAFNTAASFTTNTNWQFYTGETTMSYLTQMAGLAFHNFVSAATGIVAGGRADSRALSPQRANAGQLLGGPDPLHTVRLAAHLDCRSAVLCFTGHDPELQRLYVVVHTLNGGTQTIAMGPVASQEFIKDFGTNGGGFFNANSAHPFENPNAFTNLVILLSVLVIPAGLFYMFGKMVHDTRQGWVSVVRFRHPVDHWYERPAGGRADGQPDDHPGRERTRA